MTYDYYNLLKIWDSWERTSDVIKILYHLFFVFLVSNCVYVEVTKGNV